MKTRKTLLSAALVLTAIAASAQSGAYTVTFSNPQLENGHTLYILDYDTTENIDSTVVVNNTAIFKGTVEKPLFTRVMLDGNRLGMFILEPGEITFDGENAVGSPLNDKLVAFGEQVALLEDSFQYAKNEEEQMAIYETYQTLLNDMMNDNLDNPIGFYFFMQQANQMDRDEFMAFLEKAPQMKQYQRVKKMEEVFDRQDATSPGKMFTDFEIEYNGETHRLSDYVGKGNYTLVDFWASWCGPCIRETAVIKDLYKEYGPKGLDVVGIAVWDEPDNTLAAIKKHNLPWKQVINGQSIPTDLYGILGIPCIILFAPDGTIVSRGLQDDDLRASVAAAFAE